MKRTKLLALALAGVMALALLTGCSDSSSKAKQVEECFRSRMQQKGDYQRDETLDKKLEAIAQQFQPNWLAGGGDRLTEPIGTPSLWRKSPPAPMRCPKTAPWPLSATRACAPTTACSSSPAAA